MARRTTPKERDDLELAGLVAVVVIDDLHRNEPPRWVGSVSGCRVNPAPEDGCGVALRRWIGWTRWSATWRPGFGGGGVVRRLGRRGCWRAATTW